jgi:hypothetical protein
MGGRYQNCLHSQLCCNMPVSHCSVGLNCLYVLEFFPFAPTSSSSTPHGSYPKLPLYVAYPFLSSVIPHSTHTSSCTHSVFYNSYLNIDRVIPSAWSSCVVLHAAGNIGLVGNIGHRAEDKTRAGVADQGRRVVGIGRRVEVRWS